MFAKWVSVKEAYDRVYRKAGFVTEASAAKILYHYSRHAVHT